MEHPEVIEYRGWNLKVRKPQAQGPYRALFLLHGLKGDENVMWIFTPRLPNDALIIAPRALYPVDDGGFTWQRSVSQGWSSLEDLRPAADKLLVLLDDLQREPPDHWQTGQVDFGQIDLLGFSQGSALSYVFSLLHPVRVRRLGGLAGFMPSGVETLVQREPLAGKPVFVAHGTKDETIPVARAEEAVRVLEQAGANVTFCLNDVGHKVSLDCFKGLGEFFTA